MPEATKTPTDVRKEAQEILNNLKEKFPDDYRIHRLILSEAKNSLFLEGQLLNISGFDSEKIIQKVSECIKKKEITLQ